MQVPIRIVIISLLVSAAGAGVQHHDPQDLQSAFNLFNWIKNLLNLGGGGNGNNPNQNFENGIVTMCPPNIVFVLDGSDSVSPNGFRLAQRALAREIRAVSQAFAKTDVGVILFSDVTEESPLQRRTPQQLEELIQQVENFVQPRRKTSIPTALRRARQILLDYSVSETRAYNGDRSGMVIVLLSDGHPDNERATIQEAKIAKDRGILLITLSLEDAYLTLLKDISHIVQEYRTAIDWPSLVACPRKDLQPVPRGSECRDLLLVVDGSDSVLSHQETVRVYLAYTVLRYQYVTNAMGVNIYGTDSNIQAADTRIRLQEDKFSLADKIRLNLMFPTTGGTGTDRAVTQSVGMLNDNIRNKPAAIILITDGPTLNRTATRDAIESSRRSGYPVIIIRVGTAMTDEELNFISGGSSSDVFSVANFTELFAVQFDNKTCGPSAPCTLNPLSCRPPRVFNQGQCACACNSTCPGGMTHDTNCDCICPHKCPAGQVQGNNCACICPTTCPPGTTQLTNCSCATCPYTCKNGQFQDAWCACQCGNVCPSNLRRAALDCDCVCPNDNQPPGLGGTCDRILNCNNFQCPPLQVARPGSNTSCECQCRENRCPNNAKITSDCISCTCLDTLLVYNPISGQCDFPICQNVCPPRHVADVTNRCQCVCNNSCPSGQFSDTSRNCDCACSNVCPAGQTGDPNNNCICVCDVCPNGQRPSVASGCRCGGPICPNTCPTGQFGDPNNNCICICDVMCPNGQRASVANGCGCGGPICSIPCPTGQIGDPNNNCICMCDVTCSNGQRPSVANGCRCGGPICSNTCLNGQAPNPNNNCACECPTGCRAGLFANPNNNCRCECPNVCRSGLVADPDRGCACLPPVCNTSCRFPHQPNPDFDCRCQCPVPNDCPATITTRNVDTCACECLTSGRVYNPSTRTCDATGTGCPSPCPPGLTQNPNTCACVCLSTCPTAITRLNSSTCACECLNSAQVYNPSTLTCTPRCGNTCLPGQTQDANTCNCLPCPNTCPPGHVRCPNNTCDCIPECIINCPPAITRQHPSRCECQCLNSNHVYNPTTSTCGVCQTTCPPGLAQNPNTCACECLSSCPTAITRLNSSTCACECLNSAQVYDPSTLTCRCGNSCPNGRNPDPNNCSCGPICSNYCPAATTTQDLATCACRCYNSAHTYNPTTSTCGCASSCPPGQNQDPNSCLCTSTCPNTCPPDITRQLAPTCECRCLDEYLTYNITTNTCDDRRLTCDIRPESCFPPKVYSQVPCGCFCPRQCPDTATQASNCDCQCLNPTLRYDSRTNTCVPVPCRETCPAPAVLNTDDCSCTCPQGYFFNTTTRACDTANGNKVCPSNKLTCENNQVAYEDCSGHCFCACSSGFAGIRCEIRVQAELCNDCHYDNGHYHAGVRGYCDLYVSCIPLNHGTNNSSRPTAFIPYVMPCAPGTFYITRPNGWTGCDFLRNGRCAHDRCETLPPAAKYSDDFACQSYWQCGTNRRLASKNCCPAGQSFNPVTSECAANSTCAVTCGRNTTACHQTPTDTGCPFTVNPNNPNEYFHKVMPGVARNCPATLVMDLGFCTCVPGRTQPDTGCRPVVDLNFDQESYNSEEDRVTRVPSPRGLAANFNGSNNYILKTFAGSGFWTDYFQINLRLQLPRPISGSRRTAVVSNADCNVTESVSITMDGTNCYFKVFQMNSTQPVEIAIPYQGLADSNGWYNIILKYRRVRGVFEFFGQIGSNTQIYRGPVALTDHIDFRTCAMHIGYGYLYTGLVGYVDDFQVWRCDPSP